MTSWKDWPRQPFIGISLAAVAGILVAESWAKPEVGFVLALAALLAGFFARKSFVVYVAIAAAFFYLHSARQTYSPGLSLSRELGDEKVALSARGIVASEPQISARGTASFRFRLESITYAGSTHASDAIVLVRWQGDVRYGDELQLFGVAEPPEPPRNLGEFDMRAYLARQDVRRLLIVRYPENGKILRRDQGNPIISAALKSRVWMQTALGRGLEDSPDLQGLISGMVLGATGDTPEEIEEQFQQTGTLHLFAVSGLNVAIIAQLLWIIALALRIPRRWAIAPVIAALFFYAVVTGLNASSVRAALMAAILFGGFYFERNALAANSLGAAAFIVLAYDTNQLFSTGFQLSFAVVVAIFCFAKPIFEFLEARGAHDPFLPRALLSPAQRLRQTSWSAVAGGTAVSLAAWIGSLPLILPYFYLITPVSLLANLIVVPLAFFVLAFGLMSLLVVAIAPWLAVMINNANWLLATGILRVVAILSQAPAGHIYLERPHLPSGARVELTALDLGSGAAIHLRDRHRDWLIDCGSERNFRRIVRGYLHARGINRADGLILTHGDAAHIGGAALMFRQFRPREIIDTAAPDRSTAHRSVIARFENLQVPRKLAVAEDELILSQNVRARILFPPRDFVASAADDQALVAQLVIANQFRVLLMSDSGEATEHWLLEHAADLQSDVVIKGQHNSGASGCDEFLDVVRPQLIVASARDFPANESISPEWAEKVNTRGITLLRQDETGAVTLRFYRQRWEAEAFLGGKVFRSVSR